MIDYKKAYEIAIVALEEINGDRTPRFFPQGPFDIAKNALRDIRELPQINLKTSSSGGGNGPFEGTVTVQWGGEHD